MMSKTKTKEVQRLATGTQSKRENTSHMNRYLGAIDDQSLI